jgi:hypothetical protein
MSNELANPGQQFQPGQFNPYGYENKPENYLVLAIVTTIMSIAICFNPFSLACGIASLVYSSKVEGQFFAGDFQGALDSSSKAKNWGIAAAVILIVGVLLVVALWVVLFASFFATYPMWDNV